MKINYAELRDLTWEKIQKRISFDRTTIQQLNADDNPVSNRIMGCFYLYTKKDIINAKMLLQKALSRGDVQSALHLGIFYRICEKVPSLQKKYLIHAAQYGIFGAANELGMYYEVVERNSNMAIHNFKTALQQNDTRALVNIGNYYLARRQDALAKQHFQSAIENGHLVAHYNLAKLYEFKKKPFKMKLHAKAGIKHGDQACQRLLHQYYLSIGKVVEPRTQKKKNNSFII